MSDTKPQFDELRREGRRVYDSRGRLIARCSEQHPPREKTPPYWVQEAYAQLFKASPKMLAACELFLRFDAENCQAGTIHYDQVKAAIQAAVAEAKADDE